MSENDYELRRLRLDVSTRDMELADAQRTIAQLTAERDSAVRERNGLHDALSATQKVAAERAEQLDAAIAERDEARQSLEVRFAEYHAAAKRTCESLAAQVETLTHERDSARRERDEAVDELDSVREYWKRAAAERDAARVEAAEVWRDRDAQIEAKHRLVAAVRAEHATTVASLRAALVECCDIAARVVADAQVLPSTDSDRIAELRRLAEAGE
jgi:chromosome segregation ATPase